MGGETDLVKNEREECSWLVLGQTTMRFRNRIPDFGAHLFDIRPLKFCAQGEDGDIIAQKLDSSGTPEQF